MCHWVLRVVSILSYPCADQNLDLTQWQCGDSFFTKYSSCSFDRAAHAPANPINPLHPLITPYGPEKATSQPTVDMGRAPRGPKDTTKVGGRGGVKSNRKHTSRPTSGANGSGLSQPTSNETASTSIDTHPPSNIKLQDAKAGEVVPLIPLSEVGKASRFGDKTLGTNSKCNVFEVVLQTKETTICPACARSPRRARLPAHARGIYGLS